MNFRGLQALQALVKSGTTKGAAVNIGISQPTISRAIVEVETPSRGYLFARRHGRPVPTPAALRISQSVAQISGILDYLQQDLDQLETEQVLRIGVSLDSNGSLIQQVLRRFTSMHCGVTVRVELMSDADLSRAVSRGMIDLGLSGSPETAEEIVVEQVFNYHLCCILPTRHRLERAPAATPDMLVGEHLIAVRNDQSWAHKANSAFRDTGIPFSHNLEVSSMPHACEFVASGMGVAFCAPLDLIKSSNPILLKPFLPVIECKLFSMVHVTGSMHQTVRQFSRLVRLTSKSSEGDGIVAPTVESEMLPFPGYGEPLVISETAKKVALQHMSGAAFPGMV